ncbi:UDP-N-acetylmuramoyl-tripeptide--D-alanyl-D-alanine ligase [Roseivirga misakiensis]|uniref:UDP-N-acetylmuramoyl-tripeptide--D-alanyl-D-alanine ligase n=1 Tax=Roseivirga misakiensis TaxID=1563681 RepID=A0A1E5T4B2_9BACT|nr:UDP-N-acetylmuramoyl-tripeptide--D-alanyl-D-alanine ligase [Roseivirga misakiensis]OEK06233.1 UDP-N-acetylmuramoyl-tripeptide--D-alanyl-D-alanine ligase [Roseivirga misakiensis]
MIDQLYAAFQKSTGVSTDTRTIKSGNIWFALKGPNFNANRFADQALEKGAGLVVIDDENYAKDDRYFVVEDTLRALQKLGNHHRNQFSIPFIGITGSNGKTTTKELLRDVLAKKYKVHATGGNFNNHIGVPLTLLQIDESIEIAIIEMGANKVGDIAELCGIADPTHGMITNIGKAHLEGFGGVEGVIRGKSELYHHLIQKDGVIFVNSNSEVLSHIAKRRMKSPFYYPAKGDYFHAELIQTQPVLRLKTEDNLEAATHLTGAYNFENMCAALCIGKYFEVTAKDALKAVADYDPDNNRSQVIKKGSNTIILDAYNANPSSMAAALAHFSEDKSDSKVVILGDMFELGEDAAEEHKAIGALTLELGFDEVHLCGTLMEAGKLGNEKAHYWQTKEALVSHLKENPIRSSTVLIKGSRGMSLESLLDNLT